MPTCLIDFFKTSAESGGACCNSIASSQTDRVDAYQIRTKSTDGADLKQGRGNSVARSCCGTLNEMVLGCESGFVWSTY